TWWDPVYMAFATKPKQFIFMAKKELFTQCPQAFRQNLKSLLYFTQHPRIAQTLTALGATHVHTIAHLSDALHYFSSRSNPQ
ncbi:MAG: hypothetical protein ACFNS8_08505, partial [Kingella oralis]